MVKKKKKKQSYLLITIIILVGLGILIGLILYLTSNSSSARTTPPPEPGPEPKGSECTNSDADKPGCDCKNIPPGNGLCCINQKAEKLTIPHCKICSPYSRATQMCAQCDQGYHRIDFGCVSQPPQPSCIPDNTPICQISSTLVNTLPSCQLSTPNFLQPGLGVWWTAGDLEDCSFAKSKSNCIGAATPGPDGKGMDAQPTALSLALDDASTNALGGKCTWDEENKKCLNPQTFGCSRYTKCGSKVPKCSDQKSISSCVGNSQYEGDTNTLCMWVSDDKNSNYYYPWAYGEFLSKADKCMSSSVSCNNPQISAKIDNSTKLPSCLYKFTHDQNPVSGIPLVGPSYDSTECSVWTAQNGPDSKKYCNATWYLSKYKDGEDSLGYSCKWITPTPIL